MLALAEAAALSDPELSGPRDRGHEGQRAVCRQLARKLQSRGLLESGLDESEATDILFALTGEAIPAARPRAAPGHDAATPNGSHARCAARCLKG
jgi:hypothetical protein